MFQHAPSEQQWEAIRGSLAASTHLTKLQMVHWLWGVSLPQQELEQGMIQPEDAGLCRSLAGLANLKTLSIVSSHLAPGEALALTALTSLTWLVLSNLGAGVSDLAATAIASSCQQLRHLNLRGCASDGMACLAVVRNLTQLTGLCLELNRGLTRHGLMLLTGLKRLQDLRVIDGTQVTAEDVDSFWAVVRQ
jgi:hypothetical protein